MSTKILYCSIITLTSCTHTKMNSFVFIFIYWAFAAFWNMVVLPSATKELGWYTKKKPTILKDMWTYSFTSSYSCILEGVWPKICIHSLVCQKGLMNIYSSTSTPLVPAGTTFNVCCLVLCVPSKVRIESLTTL